MKRSTLMLCVLALAFCATAPIGAAKLPNPKLDRIVVAQMSPHMGGAFDGKMILPPRAAPSMEGPMDYTRPGLQRNRPWPRHPTAGG